MKNVNKYSINNEIHLKFSAANAADLSASKHSSQFQSIEKTEDTPMFPKKLPEPPQLKEHPPSIDSSEGEDDVTTMQTTTRKERSSSGQLSQHSKYSSKLGLHSPGGSTHSFDLQVNNRYTTKQRGHKTEFCCLLLTWNGCFLIILPFKKKIT